MKSIKLICFILFLLPALSFAGEISGTINMNGKPYAKLKVSITAPDGKEIATTVTDDFGYYVLNVKPTGKFKMSVVDEAQKINAVTEIFSNNSATCYNFELNCNSKKECSLVQK